MRILTKNAAVVKGFDLVRRHRDRVLVSLSLTGTPDKENVLTAIEPYASPISERLAALKKAHQMGLRTYGMPRPLLPGIANAPEQIDWLVWFVANCGAEEVFAEAANPRGNGLRVTEETLRENGFEDEAAAVSQIRHDENRSPYTVDLIRNVQKAMRRHMTTKQMRFLLYPTGLAFDDEARIRKADAGLVWL